MKTIDNLTEYRSLTAELQNISQNHESYKKQISDVEAVLEELKKNESTFADQRKTAEKRLGELTDSISADLEKICEEYETVSKENTEKELAGFETDEEQKALIDAFQKEATLFEVIRTASAELGIEHGYSQKMRSIVYKPKPQETTTPPTE